MTISVLRCLILTFHLFSVFFLTGLIWIVQIVHYPAFHFISASEFKAFHNFHSRKITWVVAPIMLLELGTAAALWFQNRQDAFMIGNLLSVILVWIFTGFVSVPIHNRLGLGREVSQMNRLVRTNWLRTACWSLRSAAWLLVCSVAVASLQKY